MAGRCAAIAGNRNAAPAAALIRDRFAGKTVLLVGHSNTIPAIIRALGIGDVVTIPDWEYDDLFTVKTDATGRATLGRSRFGVASVGR